MVKQGLDRPRRCSEGRLQYLSYNALRSVLYT